MASIFNVLLISLLVVHGAAVTNMRGAHLTKAGSVLGAHQEVAQPAAAAAGGTDYVSLGLGAGIGAVIVAAIAFFVLKKGSAPKEGEEGESKEGEATEEKTAEAAPAVEEPEEEVQGNSTDYQKLLTVLAQKVAQEVGPKLSKAGGVKNVLDSRMSSFTDKAKSFLLSEMNGTAGAVLKEMHAEETMLLLDWNHAVEANFPPASILIAGVLSPTVLNLMSFNHLLQMLTVGLPIACLCIAAIVIDWSAPCSIPTVFSWLFTQTALALLLVIGHGALFFKVWLGKRSLAAKSAEVQAKKDAEGTQGMGDLKDEFVSNTIILQEALIIETDIRHSFWNMIVGFATFAWVITTVWNLVLVCGWTFVPGVVAFHPKAAEVAKGDYCGAWMTVLVLKINMLLAVLYLFLNLATVVQWICDMMIESQGFQQKVLEQARQIDKSGSGLPVVELIVKAFLLRGGSDTLNARMSVVQCKKSAMEKEKAALEAQLASVTSEITSTQATEEALKEKAANEGGEVAAKVKELHDKSADMKAWQSSGEKAMEEAEARAREVQEATTKALEELWEKINQAVEAAENSETAKMIKAKALEAEAMIEAKFHEAMDTLQDPAFQQKLKDAANQASKQAQDIADQAMAAAKDPELLNKMNEKMEQARKAAEDLAAAANDPVKRKELQEKAQKAMQQAQEAAKQAAATVQDPEMQRKMKEATMKALDEAQVAAHSAILAAQDPEMQKKLKEQAVKAMEDAKAAAKKAADAAQDPEMRAKLEAAAKKAMADAQEAAEKAKDAAMDPEMQKKLLESAQKYAK